MRFTAPYLLPSGFHDTLPPDAERETRVIAKLLHRFHLWGYDQVKPPIIEFEAGLLAGQPSSLDTATFRVLDPISRQMMALRADMTTQVARMAVIRLKDEPLPVRLCYSGQIVKVSSEGLHAERQLSKAGVECIGAQDLEADIEVVILAAEALKHTEVGEVVIDFSLPQLAQQVLAQAQFTPAQHEDIRRHIERKDTVALQRLGGEGLLLAKLVAAGGPARIVLEQLEELNLPEASRAAVAQLAIVVNRVAEYRPDLSLTIDPLEYQGFEYHSGISFAIFSRHKGEELGRGGRYIITLEEANSSTARQTPATGFTLSVPAILRAAPKKKTRRKILVAQDISLAEREKLAEQGVRTVAALSDVDLATEAKRLHCDGYVKQGKIHKLK